MRTLTQKLTGIFTELANMPDAYFARRKMVGAPWLQASIENLNDGQALSLHEAAGGLRWLFTGAASKCPPAEMIARTKADLIEAQAKGATIPLVARARYFAAAVHAFEVCKSGEPYIKHPWRMAYAIKRAGGSEMRQALAYAHDTVEHGKCTLEDYAAMAFPAAFIRSLDALTRRKNEPYADFCQRLSLDADAVIVKLADGDDNKNRRYVWPWKRTASFKFKKHTAYPVTQQYLRDVATGKTQGGAPFAQWMSGSEDLPPRLRDPRPMIAAGMLTPMVAVS